MSPRVFASADLAGRIALVETNLRACTLCPWRCGVDRIAAPAGTCGLGAEGRVFHHYLSLSEEAAISPTYEIFLTGCSHRCRFCYVLDRVVAPERGRLGAIEDLRRGLLEARRFELRTVSFVGGEPTVNLLAILRLVEALSPPEPLVWNSNLYISAEAHAILAGFVTWVVGDIHFGNDACAREVGEVSPYFAVVTASALAASRYARLILRHLLMPGHRECCFEPIAAWAARHLPQVPFHILDNYLANGAATPGVLGGRLPQEEARRARDYARSQGLTLVS